jgi:hypothetical protein
VKSWPPEAWKIGGGTVWGWISYDPQLDLIYYGTANPGPWNPSSGPATTSGPPASSRAGPTPARRAGSTSTARTTCTTTTASTRTSCSTWTSRAASARCWCTRPQRLRVRDRPRHRPGAVGHALRAHHHQPTASTCRPGKLKYNPKKEPRTGEVMREHLPGLAGRQGLAALGLVAAHPAAVHAAPEPVPGRRPSRPATSPARPTSAPTTRCTRARRQPRRVHGLGPGRGRKPGRSRRTSRCGAARWPPPATWCSTAPWTAGSRPSTRKSGKLLWQFKTGSGIIGQPISLPRPGRQAVHRHPVGRRRLGRRHRVRRPRRARRHRRQRLRQRDEGPAAAHGKGGTLYVFALP